MVGALACELKAGDSDSNTAGISDSSSDGSSSEGGTEGVSSTSGDPATTGGPVSSTGGSASSTTTADPGTTTADPGTSSTSVGTSVGTSMSSVTTDPTGDPVEPKPCEGPAAELKVESLSYLYSQIPPMPDPTGGSSSTTGGEPTDPDTVYVRLSNQAASCDDPSPGIECGPNWQVTIAIPPAFQTPGLYHLTGPEVIGSAFETGKDDGNGDCSFGGGSFIASFELIAIDDKSVQGRLCHVEDFFFDNKVDLEGAFTAPRCP